jgi:hypothetical protein
MFELHMFFPLLELSWQVDPNKTAEVLGVLIAQAREKKMEATVSILEHSLMQLAEGHSLQRVG